MCTSLLYLIFPFSLPLVLYNTASSKHIFLIRHCRTSQAVLKTIFLQQLELLHHMCNEFLENFLRAASNQKSDSTKSKLWGSEHNFKSNALYHNWSGNTRVGSGAIKLKKHQFSKKNVIDSWFRPLLSLHKGSAVNFLKYVCWLFVCSNRELW